MSDLWATMADRERDAEIARVVFRWSAADMRLLGDLRDVPHYTTDHAAARLVEDEIERRGLQEGYIEALDKLVTYERESGWVWFRWGILRATPAQRCEAAWRTIGGK